MSTPVKRTPKAKTAKANQPPFEVIFNQLQDAVGVSSKGMHVFCNNAYAKLFGFKCCAEIIGTQITDRIASSERKRIEEYQRRRQIGEQAPAVYESRGLRRDGSEFEMEVRTSTFELNGVPHTLVILHDLSESKKTELEMRHSGEEYRSALAA